jgi:LLM-partnered FMN reductase
MASGAMPNAAVERAKELVCAADGIVAITPVFAASYSGVGVFKMFVDALGTDALNGMPMIVAATAGTARHSLVLDHALRPLFAHLRAVVVPTGVFAATEDFGGGEARRDLTSRVTRAASELAALVVSESGAVGGFTPGAAPRTRTPGGPGDPVQSAAERTHRRLTLAVRPAHPSLRGGKRPTGRYAAAPGTRHTGLSAHRDPRVGAAHGGVAARRARDPLNDVIHAWEVPSSQTSMTRPTTWATTAGARGMSIGSVR